MSSSAGEAAGARVVEVASVVVDVGELARVGGSSLAAGAAGGASPPPAPLFIACIKDVL